MDYANLKPSKKRFGMWKKGIDMVMVKPGIAYLDIVRRSGKCPVTVYHGFRSMIIKPPNEDG
jgi:delta-aminolevulinic acid dehydratase/porphobilinogen synthase